MERPADVWVTRARPGAEATAERLRERGWTPLVAPLLEVRPLPVEFDLEGVGALAFTSANAVPAASRLAEAGLRVFAVGDATAEAARAAGFHRVESAAGDVAALAALVAQRRESFDGDLLHVGALEPAGDLSALIAGKVAVRRAAVYDTVVLPISPEAQRAWPHLRAVLLHSPKAARAFAAAAEGRATDHLRLLCLSPAVAQALGPAAGIMLVALRPDEPTLLNLLDVTGPRGDGTNIA